MSWKGKNRTYCLVLRLRRLFNFHCSLLHHLFAAVVFSPMIGLNHLGFALSRGSSPAISCGIPSAWKMAPRWPPRLYQLLHYLSYIDYIVRDDFFLPIAPADVSAVARSTLEFFTCLFRVVLACFSTRRCF